MSHGVNFFLSLSRLIRVTGYQPRFHATLKAALAVAAGLTALHWLLPVRTGLVGVLVGSLVFLAVYGAVVLLTGALTKADLRWIIGMAKRRSRTANNSASE